MPLYALGLMGGPRRTSIWYDPGCAPWLDVAFLGALMILGGFLALILQIWRSVRRRDILAVPLGDPWDGRSREWALPAPVPEYNFPVLPQVTCRDTFWEAKRDGAVYQDLKGVDDIEIPANSACAPLMGSAFAVAAFGMVWQMWWLSGLGAALALVTWISRSFVQQTGRTIPAREIS